MIYNIVAFDSFNLHHMIGAYNQLLAILTKSWPFFLFLIVFFHKIVVLLHTIFLES